MSPYDSIKYHKQVMQASFMAMDPVTGEIKHGSVVLISKHLNMTMLI
jgi:hypothetical protein